MKVTNVKFNEPMKKTLMEAHPPIHEKHMPPHVRGSMLQIEFDEEDMAIFYDVAHDEDTAEAWIKVIQAAPPEKKILIHQILSMIKEKMQEKAKIIVGGKEE